MLRQRWAAYMIVGAGCAIVAMAAGAVLAAAIYLTTASVREAAVASYSATRSAQDILTSRPEASLAAGGPAPMATADSATTAGLQANLNSTPIPVDTAPAGVNQAPSVRPSLSGTSTSPTAAPSITPDQPIPTHTTVLTRTPTATHTHTPTRTPTALPATRTPTSTRLPPTASPTRSPSATSPPAESTGDIRVLYVGYASSTNPNYEHIQLVNCDSKAIDVTNWKIKSVATGDIYTLPSYSARPGCQPQVRFTVNTHRTGSENDVQGIFTWDQPASRSEWPNQPGRVEIYDATGAKRADCGYQPDPAKSEVACQ